MTDDQRKQQPPLSTRECADYIGVTPRYVTYAIERGELRAERLQRPGRARALYRIHEDDFIAWLRALGWSTPRLPKTGTE